MTSSKISPPRSADAHFRYLLVSQVLSRVQQGYSRTQAIRDVASVAHFTLEGIPRRVSERTLHRWFKAVEESGVAGLEPQARSRPGTSVLPAGFLRYCVAQKSIDRRASVPELIKRARQEGIISERERVSRTTLYRALKRAGVAVHRRKRQPHDDKRRFAYAQRMQMLLCDGKHFRVGVGRQRRVALFFLDDATRYGLEVVVGTSETSRLFLRGLHEVICHYGLPRLLFCDRGSGFTAHDTVQVVSQLGIGLIHGTPAYPEGHGKIERFHQTSFGALLRTLDGRPDVDPDCEAVRLRLRHWLTKGYNATPHESLAGQTPFDRFHTDPTPLRFPDTHQKLDTLFVITLNRRVSADNIVAVDSDAYELPKGYAGERVLLYRHVLTDTIHFQHADRLIQLQPVDTAFNARRTPGHGQADEGPVQPPVPSAADLSFTHDYGPLVGPDGGFREPNSPPNIPSTEEEP